MDEMKAAREMNAFDRLQKRAYEMAAEHGWNQGDAERSFGDWIALNHTELSEAYEEYREHRGLTEVYYEWNGHKYTQEERDNAIKYDNVPWREFKPCGIPIEMADVIIRILHFAEFAGFNLYNMVDMKMKYNDGRPFRHGGKKV